MQEAEDRRKRLKLIRDAQAGAAGDEPQPGAPLARARGAAPEPGLAAEACHFRRHLTLQPPPGRTTRDGRCSHRLQLLQVSLPLTDPLASAVPEWPPVQRSCGSPEQGAACSATASRWWSTWRSSSSSRKAGLALGANTEAGPAAPSARQAATKATPWPARPRPGVAQPQHGGPADRLCLAAAAPQAPGPGAAAEQAAAPDAPPSRPGAQKAPAPAATGLVQPPGARLWRAPGAWLCPPAPRALPCCRCVLDTGTPAAPAPMERGAGSATQACRTGQRTRPRQRQGPCQRASGPGPWRRAWPGPGRRQRARPGVSCSLSSSGPLSCAAGHSMVQSGHVQRMQPRHDPLPVTPPGDGASLFGCVCRFFHPSMLENPWEELERQYAQRQQGQGGGQ